MTIEIYCIENTIDGKKYIGKSKEIQVRLWRHKYDMTNKVYRKKANIHLWRAVQKYGWEAFKARIVEEIPDLDEKVLADREVYWMDFYNTLDDKFGYNLVRDSSSEVIRKPEVGRRISAAHMGKKLTQEHKDKISAAGKGRKLSSEHAEKLRLLSIGRVCLEETRAKLRAANLGKKQSVESSRKKSLAAKGKKMPRSGVEKAIATKLAARVSDGYTYYQHASDGTLVRIWDNIWDVVGSEFTKGHILNVCKGKYRAKTHKGFVWTRKLK